MPGTYSIEFTQYPEDDRRSISGADFLQNKVTLNETGTSQSNQEANLELLHEAGHMVDYQKNKDAYYLLEREEVTARVLGELLGAREVTINNPDSSFPEKIPYLRSRLDKVKQIITPADFETLLQTFDKTVKELSTTTSLEELHRQEKEQEQTFRTLHAKLTLLMERRAWANALHAIRALKTQGTTVFNGTQDELFSAIDRNLFTYHEYYKEYLTPSERFTKRNFTNKPDQP